MRRLIGLLLIASSGWLLYRLGGQFVDLDQVAAGRVVGLVTNPNFMTPGIAGLLGLVGGVIALAGGVGGAMLALIGGAVAVGFGVYVEQPVWDGSFRFWENDLQLGVAMLLLAAVAAILGRD